MLSSSASASGTVPRRSDGIEPRSRSVTGFGVACVMGAGVAAGGHADVVFGAAETRVNKFTAGQQRMVAVDVDGSGSFVVVWASASEDGSGYGVFAQRFNSAAVPIGTEFRVNSFTVGDQKRPAVAVDKSTSNFVVVWQSYRQVTTGWSIHGQRFDSAGSRIGGEFVVSSTAQATTPSVAVGASKILVLWETTNASGMNLISGAVLDKATGGFVRT